MRQLGSALWDRLANRAASVRYTPLKQTRGRAQCWRPSPGCGLSLLATITFVVAVPKFITLSYGSRRPSSPEPAPLGYSCCEKNGTAALRNGTVSRKPGAIELEADVTLGLTGLLRVKVAPGRGERYWDWNPVSVGHAGSGRVALLTAEGTYVSAHADGNLSAYATRLGRDEEFEEFWVHNASVAFKSSFGKYLRVGSDGGLTAGSSIVGSAETFTKANDTGGDVRLKSHGQIIATVSHKVSLITSTFITDHPHVHEINSALLINLQNEVIFDVHLITESNCSLILGVLEAWADQLPNTTLIRREIRRKLICVPSRTGAQPTYKDFFQYANDSLAGNLILFSNGDIVFDESLRRIAPEKIMTNQIALVLGVKPPPTDSQYKEVFGFECKNQLKCAVGSWQGGFRFGGVTWDAFIFASPLSSAFDLPSVDVVMNRYGAEQVAAYQFEGSGTTLYNACENINAFHWHCQGGKMHPLGGAYARVDKWPRYAVKDIYPCWRCPGVTLPKGYAAREDLCRDGQIMWPNQLPAIYKYFSRPHYTVGVCCSNPYTCGSLYFQWLGSCLGAEDVDCMLWEFIGPHTFYVR